LITVEGNLASDAERILRKDIELFSVRKKQEIERKPEPEVRRVQKLQQLST